PRESAHKNTLSVGRLISTDENHLSGSDHSWSDRVRSNPGGFELLRESAHKNIMVVGRLIPTDENHLSGSRH
ncbi:MAG: hypothetical protein AAF220_08515, partial [Pseudomonadota bacterium]